MIAPPTLVNFTLPSRRTPEYVAVAPLAGRPSTVINPEPAVYTVVLDPVKMMPFQLPVPNPYNPIVPAPLVLICASHVLIPSPVTA